ncbi:MAG: sigma 54-interacting transcriptional regulator [Desulfovibrio sp.]|jgi:PAS domain S-box-containing protein|nr:sigma 54-interacting transcriptional regulator [Desulfovibrio sp.]
MDDVMELEVLRRENERLYGELNNALLNNYIYETIMNILPDGFLVVSRDGSIRDINEAYCKFFGVSRESVIGTPIRNLIPNTKMLEIMEKNLTEIDTFHEFIAGTTAGELRVAVTRLPVRTRAGEMFASVAHIKFSRYNAKLMQSIQEMGEEIEYYRKELIRHSIEMYSFESLPTASPAYREAKIMAQRFATSDLPILLQGETGVGKEVFANAIHNASERSGGPFICINCTTIPADLLESELFGYEDGAFTGGRRGGKRGKFEMADKGTLLLDEIGDMPLSMQVKLLRVLQDNVIEKVGSERPTKVDVRILAATNQNLEQKIKDKTFREDLYYRLNVLPVFIPPLRERIEDIPALAYAILEELNNKYVQKRSIALETISRLQQYSWPGNIRELRNVIGRCFMTCDQDIIKPDHLPPRVLTETDIHTNDGHALNEMLVDRERDMIVNTLLKYTCNCSKTAKALSVHRSTLYAKMQKYSISLASLRQSLESPDRRIGI